MKTFFILVSCMAVTAAVQAQQPADQWQHDKKKLDSLLAEAQKSNYPFVVKVPGTFTDAIKTGKINGDFETVHSDAIVINKTSRGTIYSLSPDNMAVLVPDMQKVEKMPGSNQYFTLPPQSNMPNPLYPQVRPRKKKE